MKLTNRVLSVLVALALLVLGVLVVVEIVWVLGLGGTREVLLPYPATTDYLAGLTWGSRTARAILAGLVVVGALLLVYELRRRKPGLLRMASTEGSVTTGVDRRALEKAAAAAATDVDGIGKATARVSARRVSVSATSGLRDAAGLQGQVTAALQSWMDGLDLAKPPALSVRVVGRS
jgi:hypothetical protein